jgi:hypothetical protein
MNGVGIETEIAMVNGNAENVDDDVYIARVFSPDYQCFALTEEARRAWSGKNFAWTRSWCVKSMSAGKREHKRSEKLETLRKTRFHLDAKKKNETDDMCGKWESEFLLALLQVATSSGERGNYI